jgi:hypothetical protein
MSHLLANGFSGMVFDHLQDCIHPEDLTSGFLQLFQLSFHIAYGHIPPQISCVFRATCFLAMTQPSSGIRPITMGEALYQLTSHTLCM